MGERERYREIQSEEIQSESEEIQSESEEIQSESEREIQSE